MRNRFEFMEEAGAQAAPGGAETPNASAAEPSTPDPQAADWRSSLPPDLRDSPALQDVPDVATLAKQYQDTKAMVGSSIRVPTSEAGQEAIDAFTAKLLEHENLPLMRRPDPENPEALAEVYKSLGRPEDASGYEMPEGVDAEAFGKMTEKALELGLTKQQLAGLAQAQAEQHGTVVQHMEQERMEGVARVKGEWGPAFEQKVSRATQVAESLNAPAKLVEAMKAGSVDGDTLRFLDTIATQMGAEGTPLAEQLQEVTAETMDELENKIADRTKRMLSENIPQKERDRLIQANLKDRQKIIDARG